MAAYKTYLFIILLGFLVIGGLVVIARYQRDLSAARDRVKSLGSQVLETDYGTIEYLTVGEGYPVLVVHGLMGVSTRDSSRRIFSIINTRRLWFRVLVICGLLCQKMRISTSRPISTPAC